MWIGIVGNHRQEVDSFYELTSSEKEMVREGSYVSGKFTGKLTWEDMSEFWFKEDQFHRDDGPAIQWGDGYFEWWFNGKEYSFEEYFELISKENQNKMLWDLDRWK